MYTLAKYFQHCSKSQHCVTLINIVVLFWENWFQNDCNTLQPLDTCTCRVCAYSKRYMYVNSEWIDNTLKIHVVHPKHSWALRSFEIIIKIWEWPNFNLTLELIRCFSEILGGFWPEFLIQLSCLHYFMPVFHSKFWRYLVSLYSLSTPFHKCCVILPLCHSLFS